MKKIKYELNKLHSCRKFEVTLKGICTNDTYLIPYIAVIVTVEVSSVIREMYLAEKFIGKGNEYLR